MHVDAFEVLLLLGELEEHVLARAPSLLGRCEGALERAAEPVEDLVNGGEVKVRIKDNAPSFEIVPAPPKATKAKPKSKVPAKKKAGGEAPAAE